MISTLPASRTLTMGLCLIGLAACQSAVSQNEQAVPPQNSAPVTVEAPSLKSDGEPASGEEGVSLGEDDPIGEATRSEVEQEVPPGELEKGIVDPGAMPVEVNLNGDIEHQRMEGFGATHIPLVYTSGDSLGSELRAQAIEAVYGQVGITMGNLEAGLLESPGGYAERANDNGNPLAVNWGGFDTFIADETKRSIVDLAEPLGFDNYYIATSINIRFASPWLGDLRNSDYNRYLDEVAEQIAAGQVYWREVYGIVPRYVMPLNEPLWGSGLLQPGSGQEVVDIIKRAGARLEQEGFSNVKFVVPNEETVAHTLELARMILEDPEARQYVGAIGYHVYPYGSAYASIPRLLSSSGVGDPNQAKISDRSQLRDLAQQYGIPLWMTEVSHGEVDPRSMDALRGRAIHIHDELVYADAAAFFGMNNMWDLNSHRGHFGNDDLFDQTDSIVLIDNDAETIYITGMGYAIGHYARWIDRGAIRIDANSSDPLVQVTAFRDDGRGQLVLVVINNASAPRTLNVEISGLELGTTIDGEQSTASAYWQPIQPFAPNNASNIQITVPAESVTTLSVSLKN